MVLRGDRHVIVSESVNRGYWTGVTVMLARGDVALLMAGAFRRVASPDGARMALARE